MALSLRDAVKKPTPKKGKKPIKIKKPRKPIGGTPKLRY